MDDPDLVSDLGHRWFAIGPGWSCRDHCNVIVFGPTALETVDPGAAIRRADPLGHGQRLCEALGVEPVLPGSGGS